MDLVTKNAFQFFSDIASSVFGSIAAYLPEGSGKIFTALFVIFFIALVFALAYYFAQNKLGQKKQDQEILFNPTIDILTQNRKGIDQYLQEKIVQESKANWVLFNFAPLTVSNAGFMGPESEGSYSTNAIRRALDLGFRCFVFHIDYYEGDAKDPDYFVGPGEPCLLYRDDQGTIRSGNCGRISEMTTALVQQAFSPGLATGRDPLIVILDFKRVPDQTKSVDAYLNFLKKVAQEIQPLRPSFLARLGETRFSNLENPALLFTQNFQSLKGKTLIFTNVNTDIFNSPTARNTPIEQNLRSMINAQVYSLSSDALPNDSITQVAPRGSILSVGKQTANYFLLTPPNKLSEAQLRTNNVFTIVDPPDAYGNHPIETTEKLLTQFGVQSIPFNIYSTPEALTKFMTSWGLASWKLKPKPLQYVVVVAAPPKPISPRADANGGNVSPPPLRF